MENLYDKNNKFEFAAPTPIPEEKELNNLYYNCSDCPSLIEILSINENDNIIKFKCVKNHSKKMLIKDYLEKI